MPLAAREVELIIIAKDRTGAVLARVGGALALLGAGMARVGIKGIEALAGMTGEAIELRRQAALAFTQVEIAGTSLDDVLNLIKNTAKQTSVPISELADTAYDIFSTVTLDRLEQGQMLLDQIAKSAVTGQAPPRDIGRAVFAWINALGQEANFENVNKILEIQFELVRKGAGTYTEFAEVMGRAIPAFVATDQTAEHFAATMAFLTRNGLSAANATASAARAVELLFSPKAINQLRSMGIRLTDADGTFRNMEEILGELYKRFRQMDSAERKLAFKELFGQGTIQARRFFDIVLHEGKFEDFLFLLDAMRDSAGNINEAFRIMSAEPAVALGILNNRLALLRIELGERLLPVLANSLIPAAQNFFNWWDRLSDTIKDQIVKWAAFGAVFLTVGGALTALVGSFILIAGLLKAFTGSLVLATILGGGWVALIAIIAGVISASVLGFGSIGDAWEELKNTLFEPPARSDSFMKYFPEEDWEQMKGPFELFLDWIGKKWPILGTIITGAREFIDNEWPVIWQSLKDKAAPIIDWLKTNIPLIWENAKVMWGNFVTWVTTVFWPGLVAWADSIRTKFNEELRPALENLWVQIQAAWANFQVFWDENGEKILTRAEQIWDFFINTFIPDIITFITNLATTTSDALSDINTWWEENQTTVSEVLDGILAAWDLFHDTFVGVWEILAGILTDDWGRVWNGMGLVVEAVFEGILNTIIGAVNIIITVLNGLRDAINMLMPGFDIPEIAPIGLVDLNAPAGPKGTAVRKRGTDDTGGYPGQPNQQVYQFYGGINSNADPDDIANAIAFKVRVS